MLLEFALEPQEDHRQTPPPMAAITGLRTQFRLLQLHQKLKHSDIIRMDKRPNNLQLPE
jgi:hypothetical protein